MNKLLSVIVPVYNTFEYLDKCVDSIVEQTYSNIEILLVDDGSTDGSGKKCDEWAKKDKRIKTYHKKNGGLSDARNYGIKHAGGEYIGFVDSDDWVDEKMYEELLNGCEKYGTDVGCCNRIRVFRKSSREEAAIKKSGYVNNIDAMAFILKYFDPSACNKIFKKKLFLDIEFPYGKIYEDIGTIPYVISKANGMYLSSLFGYYYNQINGDSIIHREFSAKKMDYYHHLKKWHDFLKEKYPNLNMLSDYYYALSITAIITDIYAHRRKFRDDYKLLLETLKKIDYKNNLFIPGSKKMMIFLDLHHLGWIVNMVKKLTKGGR